jgi:hypothetical protein
MIDNELYIVLWLLLAAGIYYSYKEHGKLQYARGMSDAICMHHKGELIYKITKNSDGEEDIDIRINGG